MQFKLAQAGSECKLCSLQSEQGYSIENTKNNATGLDLLFAKF